MVIKNKLISTVLILIISSSLAKAEDKILVERYEKWNHPVLSVFKKYGITVYKVSYSLDGTCPTFYAKFKYSADPRAPDADAFHRVYHETLAANSYFPYAIVDEEDDMRINVGWEDEKQTIMYFDIAKANSISMCKDGKGGRVY